MNPTATFTTIAAIARDAGLPDASARKRAAKADLLPDAELLIGPGRRVPLFNIGRADTIANVLGAPMKRLSAGDMR